MFVSFFVDSTEMWSTPFLTVSLLHQQKQLEIIRLISLHRKRLMRVLHFHLACLRSLNRQHLLRVTTWLPFDFFTIQGTTNPLQYLDVLF